MLRVLYLGRFSLAASIFVAAIVVWRAADSNATLIATLAFVATLLFTGVSMFRSEPADKSPGDTFFYIQVLFDLLLVTTVGAALYVRAGRASGSAPAEGTDVAAQIAGSVGLAGSANIGDLCAMFEAIHGSAPRRACFPGIGGDTARSGSPPTGRRTCAAPGPPSTACSARPARRSPTTSSATRTTRRSWRCRTARRATSTPGRGDRPARRRVGPLLRPPARSWRSSAERARRRRSPGCCSGTTRRAGRRR